MRIKVTLSYDGSAFHGWQIQPNGYTVQEDLQKCIQNITGEDITIYASGRTDAGVHALGQVFHFDTDYKIPLKAWKHLLDNHSHPAIFIRDVELVDLDFHSRFSAKGKTYEYRINIGEYNPFERNYVYQFNRPLDIQSMENAMKIFVGTHDFTTFNKRKLEEMPDQVRTIHDFNLIQENNTLIFRIHGNGFLRYMVRMIVGTVVACGEGKISPEDIKNKLEMRDKNASKFNIDSCGLYLVKVSY